MKRHRGASGCQCFHCQLETLATLGRRAFTLLCPSSSVRDGAAPAHGCARWPRRGWGRRGCGRGLCQEGEQSPFLTDSASTPEMQVISLLKEDLCIASRADNVASYLLLTSALAPAAARCPLSESQGASGWPAKGQFVTYSYHGDFETTALWRQDNGQQKSAAWSYWRGKEM